MGMKEGFLFNNTLNTFYLWLYDMVKDHSDSNFLFKIKYNHKGMKEGFF